MRAAKIIGSTSLLAFVVFLFFGPWHVVDLSRSVQGALLINLALSLAFFVQHSGMVRRSFQDGLAKIVPHYLTAAIYAIASGLALFAVLILWQPTNILLVSADGPWRWLLHGVFLAALLGFSRGTKSLGKLDAFGARPIKVKFFGKREKTPVLTIRGFYKWVRHPLYSMVIVMIWTGPDLTADRLLFNIVWTIGVIIGGILEERDLIALFGDDYRQYQQQVPMFIPTRRPYPGN